MQQQAAAILGTLLARKQLSLSYVGDGMSAYEKKRVDDATCQSAGFANEID
jgi:hypothetical protein